MPQISTSSDLKSILRELVAIPSVTDEKATSKAALDWYKYQVRSLPLCITDFTRNGFWSAVLGTHRRRKFKVLLHSHIDVSPAPPELFNMTERRGRYYGRGVFDMKIAAAAYLKLLLDLGDTLPNYDLGVMLTTDEELTGGEFGVKQLLKAGWRADVVINQDSVQGQGDSWSIQRAAKGTAKYRIISRGTPGHGSRPWQYHNAITQLMNTLAVLERSFPKEPCGDPEHAHNTINIGRVSGGEVVNQVPASAFAEVDIRFMPPATLDEIDALVRTAIAGTGDLSLELFAHDAPVSISPKHPEVQRVQRIIQAITGTDPSFVLAHGASESDYFAAKGMPVLMFSSPGGGHHSNDEWVDAKGARDFYDVIRRYVEETALIKK